MAISASELTPPRVVIKKTVHADRERVFEAWTKPELMQKWFFPKGWSARTSNELRVGGSFSHDMITNGEGERPTCGHEQTSACEGPSHYLHTGEYLEIKKPSRLVFTWSSPSVQNSRVTVDFRELGDDTEITITHELLHTEELRKSHTDGWGQCTANLTEFFAMRN